MRVYAAKEGRSVHYAEDFFASSPSANLVNITKKGTNKFPPDKGVELVLYAFFVFCGRVFLEAARLEIVLNLQKKEQKRLMKKITIIGSGRPEHF